MFGDTPFDQLLDEDVAMLALEIPTTSANNLTDALVSSGIATSNGEARRLIEGGAISINGAKVDSNSAPVPLPSLIKKGKNTFLLVR